MVLPRIYWNTGIHLLAGTLDRVENQCNGFLPESLHHIGIEMPAIARYSLAHNNHIIVEEFSVDNLFARLEVLLRLKVKRIDHTSERHHSTCTDLTLGSQVDVAGHIS